MEFVRAVSVNEAISLVTTMNGWASSDGFLGFAVEVLSIIGRIGSMYGESLAIILDSSLTNISASISFSCS